MTPTFGQGSRAPGGETRKQQAVSPRARFCREFQSELACLKNHSDMPEGLLRLFRQGVETRNGFSRRQTVVARPKAARIALPQPAPEGNRMQSRRIDERNRLLKNPVQRARLRLNRSLAAKR